MKYLILQVSLIITIFCCIAFSQDVEKKLYRAQQDLYNAKYEPAAREFIVISKEYPSHPAGSFFHAMTNLWQLGFKPDDTNLVTSAIASLKNAYSRADHNLNLNAKNPEMLFWRGISTGVSAVCEVLIDTAPEQRHPYIFNSILARLKTFDKFRLMLNDLQQSLKYNAELMDSHLGIALYDLYSGRNQQKGVEQLWSVIEKGKYLKVEASLSSCGFFIWSRFR